MGVHGLWELLAPVGRRVSVETLAGKRLAIDASIWMIQFMKAMRDEKGEMVRNAHILGFFRRICKLLFLRTKPVFVFDGGTPALKRRTVIARRRQRENAQAKIRKTAEKLLLNHLKAARLKELAKDLENQRQLNDSKGKRIISDRSPATENNTQAAEDVLGSYNQEALDEMLAASIAAEENQSLGDASTSVATNIFDDDDGDEDEEIILPTMHGKVDPAVLASLPPSMQLDLLVQMRERLMAENRQKYQKVKKAPARFSELQIQAYLKTVAFRREIGEVQKSATGRGIGGMQTSRIASEANREYIFSSTFTGDKQALTSPGLEKRSNDQNQTPKVLPSSSSLGDFVSSSRSKSNADVDEPKDGFSDDVETYLDENGRVRVSRNRAMGLRMTRDLQRNLDLMKESEVIFGTNENVATGVAIKESESSRKSSIEVCIEDLDEEKQLDSDDDLFAHLVTNDSTTVSKNHSSDSFSDCEWEEGSVADKNKSVPDISDEDDIEWEEETFETPQHTSHCTPESSKPISKGAQEEEFEFQEAIRLSLADLKDENLVQEKEKVKESASFIPDHQESTSFEPKLSSRKVIETYISPIVTNTCETLGNESAFSVQVYPETSSGGKTADLSTEVYIEPASQENVVKLKEDSLDPVEPAEKSEFGTVSDYCWTVERDEPAETLVKESTPNHDPVEEASEDLYKDSPNDHSALIDSEKEQQVEYMEASLEDEMMILDKERTNLNDEQRKLERNAESVSGEMFAECQELLQMFGLPYIIAPMEAEAQCAYMELTNLVDGVVTDDSDVFLFGARSVYKNIFDDRKYVETYFMKDVETELGITREKLIRMAMLLGSDYTEGVSGIGIVNAVEVVNAFPEEDGLKKFREWIESPDPSILGKADLQSGSPAKKKGSKVNKDVASLSGGIDNVTQIFMNTHRNVSKNWHIPMTFPSDAVITAYTAPQVDRSTESFSWGKPDQVVLRKLCLEKFGWGTQKADELLGPVLKEYNKRETQLRLEAFYTFNERFAKIRSKRIKKAVKGISGNKCSEFMEDSVEKDSPSKKKANPTQNPTHGEITNSTVKSASKPPRTKRNLTQKTVGKRKKKQNLDFENAEAKSSDSEQEVQAQKEAVPHKVRRSTRTRKAAKYTSDDMEIDEDDVSQQIETSNPICIDPLNDVVEPGLGQNEDPVHEAERSQEYLHMGGGFCLHDDDDDKELHKFDDSNITSNSSVDVQESELVIDQNLGHQNEEYLKMGGGFCLDDDDEKKDLNKFDDSNITSNSSAKVQDSEQGIDQNLDHQNVTTDENPSILDASENIMEDDELRTRSQTSLKAMPFLRRKRKKN